MGRADPAVGSWQAGAVPVPHAAFDFALDPRNRTARLRGAFLTAPVAVLRTADLAQAPSVVAAAEAAARAGNWVVGGLSYEAHPRDSVRPGPVRGLRRRAQGVAPRRGAGRSGMVPVRSLR